METVKQSFDQDNVGHSYANEPACYHLLKMEQNQV